MGYGEVWWLLRDDGVKTLGEAMTALRDAGLVAEHPELGVPQTLSDDGAQVPWDEADVNRRWCSGETVTAQFWLNRETDVLVELVRSHQLLTFDLDGMTTAEARITVFAVLNAALSLTGTRAVLVARSLPDRGDEVLEAATREPVGDALPFQPDLLVSAQGDGAFGVNIRLGSWLSQPAATVRSF